MNCGMNEDDLDELEREAAPRKTTCDSDERCGAGQCDSAKACNNKKQPTEVQGSWVPEGRRNDRSTCLKCKSTPAVVLVRQREPLCQACMELSVAGKVRSLKSNKLLLPNDNVVLAFSGGFSSQTLLCNLMPMRKDASTHRKERGKIDFDLTVVHVNEARAHGMSAEAAAAHGRAVEEAIGRCTRGSSAALRTLVVPLADVFLVLDGSGAAGHQHQQQAQQGPQNQHQQQAQGQGEGQGAAGCSLAGEPSSSERAGGEVGEEGAASDAAAATAAAAAAREERLQQLLQSVSDSTGREDLLRYLRCRLLAAIGTRLGANKLLRGDNASAVAARIISETAKGRGFSLPGEIQLVDARGAAAGEPAVIYPMREVTQKEAVYFCRLRGLKPVTLAYLLSARPRRSINDLAAAFVDGLQANLPSTVFTVLRAAAALQGFAFNTTAAANAATALASPPTSGGVADAGPRLESPVATGCSSSSGGGVSGEACPAAGAARNPAGSGDDGQGAVSGASQPQPHSIPCCVLCRAPLSKREQDMMEAAAARTRAGTGAGRVHGEVGGCSGPGGGAVGGDGEAGGSVCRGGGNGADAGGGGGPAPTVHGTQKAAGGAGEGVGQGGEGPSEELDDDAAAPFCLSCRNQILLSPCEAAGGGVGARSSTLPLLPSALREPGSTC